MCSAGFSGPDGGPCAQCLPGEFKAETGSAACSLCGVGTYEGGVGSASCQSCPAGSISAAGSISKTSCQCTSGYTGVDGSTCAPCSPGKYKQGFGPASCSDCPSNSLSSGGSITASDCQCNDGYAGTNGGTCSLCTAGKYNSGGFMSMLLRQKPKIVSDAVDWNVATQRFDSKCGFTTCTGNTGATEAGVVATGIVTGHSVGGPVAFVGGNTATKMQWGARSVPAAFTICSVTRYSGSANKRRILGCWLNPAGHMNWLHGHWEHRAGSNYYNSDHHSNLQFSIPVIDNWG